jgi:hypothetical protein
VEDVPGDYQSGFRQGRCTVNRIFAVLQILEKCHDYGIETHHLFIDVKAAYDRVDRFNLYIAMKELQIPALVLTTLKNSKCQIKIQNLSNPMEVKNCLR